METVNSQIGKELRHSGRKRTTEINIQGNDRAPEARDPSKA
jgi:hypothetical protein